MNLRRYSRMKESEIPGIDQVPEHWHLNRMDRVMAHQRNQVSEESMNGKLVFHYSIPSIQETGDGRYELGDEVQSGKLLVSDEVLLVSRLNPHKGCVALASPKEVLTVCSTEFVPLKATACDLRFAYYLFLSRHTVEHIVSTVQSATRSHMRAEPEVITKMWQYFPSQEEQVSIVSFLDTTLRAIDGAVRKSQLLIDRLHEYRQALITQAVTRGLDPNVPMKESGIPWLGVIPEHWRVVKLKRIAAIRYGLSQPPRELEGGVPFIRATNVSRGKIIPSDLMYVDPADVPREKKPVLQENEIIVVRSGAYTGDSAIVAHEYIGAIAGYDMVVSVTGANPHYVAYCLLSDMVLVNQIYVHRMRAAQPHLNAEELGDCLICLPSESEQSQIASFLRDRLGSVNALMSEMEVLSSVLSEYRQALITAAVTGKIDVRLEVQEHAG